MRLETPPKEKLRTSQRIWGGRTHMDLDRKGINRLFLKIIGCTKNLG